MNKIMPKKPFPWKCPNCKERSVYEEIVNYVVEMEHDGQTYSVKVDGLKTPKCTKCGEVCPDAEAYERITLAFLVLAKLLTGKQIRHNRELLGLTQKGLASAIGVAEATISRWENGAQIQQRSSDNLLRLFFGMPIVRDVLLNQQISNLEFCAISSPTNITFYSAPLVERTIAAGNSPYYSFGKVSTHGLVPAIEGRGVTGALQFQHAGSLFVRVE